MPSLQRPSDNYKPHIDGLRAVAVLMVLLQHWYDPALKVGSWGVILFFVISGYLISHSIYDLRAQGLAVGAAAKVFFVRRSTRLFPAFYLSLAIWWFGPDQFRTDWAWYAFYASNFLLDVRQYFVAFTAAWSLAVEEQFYLIWFFVLMLLPVKRLSLVFAFMLALALLSRFVYAQAGNPFGMYLPWSNLDALAAGALLWQCQLVQRKPPSWLLGGAAVLIPLLLLVVFGGNFAKILAWQAGVPLLVAAGSALLVWCASQGFDGVLRHLWGNALLVYLGRISYGIYLYHTLVPFIAYKVAAKLPVLATLVKPGTHLGFTTHVLVTVLLAAVSFRFYEVPLRRYLNQRILGKLA